MSHKKHSPKKVVATTGFHEVYEAKVGLEAFSRAGRNHNLKGIVHEVLVKDAATMNPRNIVKGTKCILAKSPTAVRDDLLWLNAGKAVKRAQLKDTAGSIAKTAKQVASGKYRGTTLMGTKETVHAYNQAVARAAKRGVKITQKMQSTGISSADTSRIANKMIGGRIGAATIKSAAKGAGVAGALVSGGLEVVSSGKKFVDGDITAGEFAGRVAKETAGGGISAAAGGVAGSVAATASAGLLATAGAPALVPIAIGFCAATVVASGVKDVWDWLTD